MHLHRQKYTKGATCDKKDRKKMRTDDGAETFFNIAKTVYINVLSISIHILHFAERRQQPVIFHIKNKSELFRKEKGTK